MTRCNKILLTSLFCFVFIQLYGICEPADHKKESKRQQVVNVRNCGAIGNGLHNDTQAIQKAIQKLANGGIVYFPKGEYLIQADDSIENYLKYENNTFYPWQKTNIGILVIKNNNLELVGEGNESIIKILYNRQNKDYFFWGIMFKGVNNGAIRNMVIDVNSNNDYDSSGIFIQGEIDYQDETNRKNNFVVDNCVFKKFRSAAMLVIGINNVKITNNQFIDGGIGLDLHLINKMLVQNNVFVSVREGLDMDKKVKYFEIIKNNFIKMKSGGDATIECNGCRHGIISENRIEGNGVATGIYLNGKRNFGDQTFLEKDVQARDIKINNNMITNCNRGIYIANTLGSAKNGYRHDCEDIMITENAISNIQFNAVPKGEWAKYELSIFPKYRPSYGVGIMLAGKGITCSSNIIENCLIGIRSNIPFLTDFEISGNSIFDTEMDGIYLESKEVNNGIIRNNIVKNSTKQRSKGSLPINLKNTEKITVQKNNLAN